MDERPRERLMAQGAAVLSDHELLAVALGSGSRKCDVLELSRRILETIDAKNGGLKVSDLTAISGVGEAKGAAIAAMLEFCRRRIRPEGTKIRDAADVYALLRHIADRKQEHLIAMSLNGAHEVIASRIVTVGLANAAHVHPREVFSEAITDRACAIIVAHNHPSGDLTPSREDMEVTQRLILAGDTLGIKLLDHVVFSKRGYYSFLEQGRIPGSAGLQSRT